jgi:ribonuclease VapC
MIVDSSAVVAVILQEPEAGRVIAAMNGATRLRVSAATFVEASIVLARRQGARGTQEVDGFLSRVGVAVEDVTVAQAYAARAAFLRFGKGRHPAALNFGDCFSYALAKTLDEPLLFVGGDFARTDVRVADA